MKKIPPSVRMKEEVTALLRGVSPAGDGGQAPMEGFVRATARYMLQVAIEAEATAFLRRGHYRRGDRMRLGWRNGCESKGLQTEAGPAGVGRTPAACHRGAVSSQAGRLGLDQEKRSELR